MQGANKLMLNETTMIEALQMWLGAKWPKDTPTVTGVEQSEKKGQYGKSATFEVDLMRADTEAAGPAKSA